MDQAETDPDYLALLQDAYHYLGRFAATRARLCQILSRRRERAQGTLSDHDRALVAAVADRCIELGLIDDAAYARARARSLADRGKGERAIRADLRSRGVGDDDASAGIAALQADEGGASAADLAAATRLARRRGLGPFGPPWPGDSEQEAKARRRALGMFARAGISYGAADLVLNAEDEDALQAALDDRQQSGRSVRVPDNGDGMGDDL